MATIKLGKSAIEYATTALQGASGVAAHLTNKELCSPVIFGDAARRYENLDAGGVTTQLQADKELADYLRKLKRNDFSLCSILFQDPWIKAEDLQNLGPPPPEAFRLGEDVYYLYDIRDATIDMLGKIRALCVSFLKLSYISTMSVRAIREKVRDASGEKLILYSQSVRHVVVSACDDETWLVCNAS